MDNDIREQLAKLAHDQWSGWMEYMFSKCTPVLDGALLIPTDLVTRWNRQRRTPYDKLSESEQDSDRAEADKFLKVFDDMFEEVK